MEGHHSPFPGPKLIDLLKELKDAGVLDHLEREVIKLLIFLQLVQNDNPHFEHFVEERSVLDCDREESDDLVEQLVDDEGNGGGVYLCSCQAANYKKGGVNIASVVEALDCDLAQSLPVFNGRLLDVVDDGLLEAHLIEVFYGWVQQYPDSSLESGVDCIWLLAGLENRIEEGSSHGFDPL